eukprot:CAMPEP_0118949330 /NCGR_PEP_ID=MMETSP1169-20130426/49428_1 /TAXON_ID=36882 /ORGANISM="Pyramimonas obovata, Strain CCMP722" /LENGTH=259 /DNA_ID=CAMNT_0006895939 /DNA_START=32 /DNA_END=808 /DNA_ORIENTATION=+
MRCGDYLMLSNLGVPLAFYYSSVFYHDDFADEHELVSLPPEEPSEGSYSESSYQLWDQMHSSLKEKRELPGWEFTRSVSHNVFVSTLVPLTVLLLVANMVLFVFRLRRDAAFAAGSLGYRGVRTILACCYSILYTGYLVTFIGCMFVSLFVTANLLSRHVLSVVLAMWGEDGVGSEIVGPYLVGYRDLLEISMNEQPPTGPKDVFLKLGRTAAGLIATSGLFLFGVCALVFTSAVPMALLVSSTSVYIGLFGIGIALSW